MRSRPIRFMRITIISSSWPRYGAVGLIAFLLFFLTHCRRGWIDARQLGPKRVAQTRSLTSNALALNTGALGAVAAIALHSVVDFNLHIPANVLVLAFVFGTLANSGTERENDASGAFPGLMVGRCFLFGIAAILGLAVWRFAPGEYYAERARMAVRDRQPLAAIGFARKGLAFEHQNPLLFSYLGRGQSLAAASWSDPKAKASFYLAALQSFESAQRLAPLDKTYLLELAFTCDALGRFAEAEWRFQEAMALDPKGNCDAGNITRHISSSGDRAGNRCRPTNLDHVKCSVP